MRPILAFLILCAPAWPQRFLSDDPLDREPRPRPVAKALNRKFSDYYDFISLQFGELAQKQPKKGPPIRALAVNTLGEPMDGAWYEKRHYSRRMSIDELKRGPGQDTPPQGNEWTVIGAKSEGITPGFVILDSRKRRYFIKFDPLTNPEMATSADSISSRLFYALGYHVPQNFIVYFNIEQLKLGEDVQLADKTGKKRSMTNRDLYEILVKVPRTSDGKYRATASTALPGKPVGPPRYYGTRKDDPNDTVPHEHRRDLRGLHVVSAWLGHDDSRAINNLDALVTENGIPHLKHYLLDFGSTLGSASQKANSIRSGAYLFSWKESAVQLFTLGLAPPYYAFAKYRYFPSIGYIEGDVFDPDKWVPEYPNPAFLNRLPDDEFWAAKQVMALRDEEIRAIITTGELSDPEAADYLAQVLIKRRDRIGKTYFAKVLPFDRFSLNGGSLAWEDLGKTYSTGAVADARITWHTFDNQTGKLAPIPAAASAKVPDSNGYIAAEITAPSRPKQNIFVYLRTQGTAKIVGIDRNW
ncbi:MAG: hypothetical protein HY820_05670 [Acidobacteria bacterium]|nr:hypothetical protein [Acidobacteriota bacterium]